MTRRGVIGAMVVWVLCIGTAVLRCHVSPTTPATTQTLHVADVAAASDASLASASYPDCSSSAPLGVSVICNSRASVSSRVTDLLSRLSVDEKISYLGTSSPGAARLALPPYQWWSEALHGVALSPGVNLTDGLVKHVTSFPMPLVLGASFDRSLFSSVADTISTEARALNNAGQAGLTFFTPNLNLFRDPRWGRGQETPGEDPLLTAEYVTHLVRGLQGDEEEDGDDHSDATEDLPSPYIKVAATCKHFLAYDMEDWGGVDRYHFDAQVSMRDLAESYLPPFETCVRSAQAAAVMCSYNSVNGVPACANRAIDEVLREEYQFDGFVVADCGAISGIHTCHSYTATNASTVSAALHAGVDLDCDNFYQDHAEEAFKEGLIDETDLDRALTRTLTILVQLGYFDPPEVQPYRQITPAAVNTPESRLLAVRAATSGFVLLQNKKDSLPWSRESVRTVALIGPLAHARVEFLGNYFGTPAPMLTPSEALSRIANVSVAISRGCRVDGNDTSGFQAAVEVARSADAVIFLGGLTQDQESEGLDRTSLDLPEIQARLINELTSVTQAGRFLAVFTGGGQVDLSEIRRQVDAILWIGYPGQAGSEALAQTIFGMVSPAGRLPVTQYPSSYADKIGMLEMAFRASEKHDRPGRTYRFYPANDTVFEFGTGLSYTTFEYTWDGRTSEELEHGQVQSLNPSSLADEEDEIESISIASLARAHRVAPDHPALTYDVCVSNTGKRASDAVVLMFLSSFRDFGASGARRLDEEDKVEGSRPSRPSATFFDDAPLKQLVAFDRISNLAPDTNITVALGVRPKQLAFIDRRGIAWLRPGLLHIGLDAPTRRVHTLRLIGPARKLS